MSDLVHKEAFDGTFKVYSSLGLPTMGPGPKRWAERAVEACLIQYLMRGNPDITSMEEFDFLEGELPAIYPDWQNTYMRAEDLEVTHNPMLQSRRNPFVPQRETFDGSVTFVHELGHQSGTFQDLECKASKSSLVEMERQGTGRILLSHFYAGGVDGDWILSESVAYLRNLGMPDETDPSKPVVVIPGYMNSQTNCLTSSDFPSVCCSDECGARVCFITWSGILLLRVPFRPAL